MNERFGWYPTVTTKMFLFWFCYCGCSFYLTFGLILIPMQCEFQSLREGLFKVEIHIFFLWLILVKNVVLMSPI